MAEEKRTACRDGADSPEECRRMIRELQADVEIIKEALSALGIQNWEALRGRYVQRHCSTEQQRDKEVGKKRERGTGCGREERKSHLISFVFGVGLGYLVLLLFRLLQLIQ